MKFESVENNGLTLKQVIENDRNYGTMVPANGKYFTYAVLNEDGEFTEKQVEKSAAMAQRRWVMYTKMRQFRLVNHDYQGIIDFRIEFRTVETDPDNQLKSNTIMYHYFPIQDTNSPFRGLCVVNKSFYYTSHGDGVFGSEFEKHGIPVQFPDQKYQTMDFDKLYGHELGHGMGLPHDTEPDNMMAYREDLMTEYPSIRDIFRMQAKYGERGYTTAILSRWLDWLKKASDR